VKLLLLSNANMQPLVRLLRPWDVSCGAYNSLLSELATLGSSATTPSITHVLCLFDTETMLGDALYGTGACEQCDAYLSALDDFASRHPEKVVVTHTFCIGSNRWLGFADITHKASQKSLEAALNTRLASIAKAHPNVLVFDLDILFRRHGEDTLVSNAFWYAGRIRYTHRMFDLLAQTIRRAVAAGTHKYRKVLVLDLDNTLWGGIVGEVGAQGIVLSEEGTGRCYRDFQRCLKAMQRTGVLLAICSKNNPADVDELFAENPMMILRRADFAAIQVNWEPKPDNIARIAEQLNLATDSFVYIDDNPAEREAVSRFFPEAAVPDFPDRIENLPTWFMREIVPTYFSKYAITEEDGIKTEQYRANEARRKLVAAFDLDGYLAELGIECSIHVDAANRLVRAAQMTQKTNQFNLTSRRYDVTDLARFVESPKHAVLMLDYRDRFGEEGSVGLAIVDLAEGRIDTLLTSCRVIGRKTEHRLLDKVIELCSARGHRRVLGEYIPSRRNQLVASFYETNGFRLSAEHPDGRKVYEKAIA
jgi:FkbH-like protein